MLAMVSDGRDGSASGVRGARDERKQSEAWSNINSRHGTENAIETVATSIVTRRDTSWKHIKAEMPEHNNC